MNDTTPRCLFLGRDGLSCGARAHADAPENLPRCKIHLGKLGAVLCSGIEGGAGRSMKCRKVAMAQWERCPECRKATKALTVASQQREIERLTAVIAKLRLDLEAAAVVAVGKASPLIRKDNLQTLEPCASEISLKAVSEKDDSE